MKLEVLGFSLSYFSWMCPGGAWVIVGRVGVGRVIENVSSSMPVSMILFIAVIPSEAVTHDDVIKWEQFPHSWSSVRGIHRSPGNSPQKGKWRGALMFSLICVGINGWVNNREAGDLRHHHAHYGVIVNHIPNTGVEWYHISVANLQRMDRLQCGNG